MAQGIAERVLVAAAHLKSVHIACNGLITTQAANEWIGVGAIRLRRLLSRRTAASVVLTRHLPGMRVPTQRLL